MYYFMRHKGTFLPTGAHVWPTFIPLKSQYLPHRLSVPRWEYFKNTQHHNSSVGKKNGLELGFGKVGMVQLICALGGEVFSSESGTGLAQEEFLQEPSFAGLDSTGESRFLCQMALPDPIPSAASLHSSNPS